LFSKPSIPHVAAPHTVIERKSERQQTFKTAYSRSNEQGVEIRLVAPATNIPTAWQTVIATIASLCEIVHIFGFSETRQVR